ncbi:ACP S-malonyltransferase [Candidatus Latescibacterota bacterium]
MNRKVCIFPGQGSQELGMGIAVADTFEVAGAVFVRAGEVTGYDMYELCADGPLEKLSDTRYTQPALFTVEAAIVDVLRAKGVVFDAAAGHSLGEFAAWYAAGAVGFEDCLRLVCERGRLMAEAGPSGEGTMAAVLGLGYELVRGICEVVGGTVVVANINSPRQVVISGTRAAVEQAGERLTEAGAKRVVPLKVSGAFHSPLMEEARASFSDAVRSITVEDAKIPVYANVTASPVTACDEIRRLMVEQLVSPVRWADTVVNMVADGIDKVYELGPGTVLAGLVKRTDERLGVTSVADPLSIEEVVHGMS